MERNVKSRGQSPLTLVLNVFFTPQMRVKDLHWALRPMWNVMIPVALEQARFFSLVL